MIFLCPTFTFSSSSLLSSSLRLGCGDLFAHEPVIPCLGGGARRQQELRLRAAVLRISDAAVHAEGERGRQFAKVISWSLDSEIL